MGLRLKFNLVLLVVFVLGLGVTGYVSYELLHRNARDEVLRNAGVMMEAALSMRGYTVGQVRPNLVSDRRQVPAAERAGVRRHRDHEAAAQEVSRLHLQGSRAQPHQPAQPRGRVGDRHRQRLPRQPVAAGDHRHARDADRALAVSGAAVPDQGPGLPRLPHHGRDGAGGDGQDLRRDQRLRLEARTR